MVANSVYFSRHCTGGDLEWGQSPQNLRRGNGPCIRLPNILRSTVIGCEAKYELTKKGVMEEYFSEIEAFGKETSHIRVIYVIYIRFQTVKTDKI